MTNEVLIDKVLLQTLVDIAFKHADYSARQGGWEHFYSDPAREASKLL